MKIYLSGVMQGSRKGHGIGGQGYRQIISEAVKTLHPYADIFDPFTIFPNAAEFDDQQSRQALFEMADAAASADIVIAYLPEASMGSAMEMVRAYDNGKKIICITSLEKNWFIRGLSSKIFLLLDDFCVWVRHTHLDDFIAESTK